jgi:MerR family regulatory protein
MRVGQLAKQAGVNVQTLRYYERRGLLPHPPRAASGYRQYPLLGALGAGFITLVASVVVVLAGPPMLAEWSGRTQIASLQQGQLERQYRVYRPAGRSALDPAWW